MQKHNNKVAVITGASRGIGAAMATLLAESGYTVCINYNNSQDAAEKLRENITASGEHAITVKADIGNEEEIISMFDKVTSELGDIAVLVNNAGYDGGRHKVEDMSRKTLESVFSTNFFGTVLCSREAIKTMKKSGGAIINISSQAAKTGGYNLSHYAASKAAVNTFSIGLSHEVKEYGIKVNVISPGVVDTDAQKNFPEEKIASLPMGRMGTPEEVAELVLEILSDNSKYESGSIIPIAEK